MTIFWQHVGSTGASRDFPKTIGTEASGLKLFNWSEIESELQHLNQNEQDRLKTLVSDYAQEGFQIWGIPAGAKSVLRELQEGDYLLLLESISEGGRFTYGGRIVAMPREECPLLSNKLWGEYRFPLIVFVKGQLIQYPWYSFCESFDYKKNWNPAGNTYRLKEERLLNSSYESESGFIKHVFGHEFPLQVEHIIEDEIVIDPIELDIESEEGKKSLRQHIRRERSAKLITQFKSQLTSFKCSICNFDFEEFYGPLGRNFIEAHHTKPIASMEEGGKTKLTDLIAVCSNCHRMIHRNIEPLTSDELKDKIIDAIRIKSGDSI